MGVMARVDGSDPNVAAQVCWGTVWCGARKVGACVQMARALSEGWCLASHVFIGVWVVGRVGLEPTTKGL